LSRDDFALREAVMPNSLGLHVTLPRIGPGSEPARRPEPPERAAARGNIFYHCAAVPYKVLPVFGYQRRPHCPRIFLIRASHMVLLHGLIKKSQKTPEAELKTAARRLADLKARLKHGTGKSKG
jgi:hypothetical protein